MRRALTVRTLVGAGILALLVAGLFYFMVAAIRAEHDASAEARVSDDRIAATIEEQKLVIDLETSLRGYLITEDPRVLVPWNDALAALQRTQQRLAGLVRDDPAAAEAHAEIARDVSEYISRHGRPLIAAVRAHRSTPTQRKALIDGGEDRVAHLRSHLGALIRQQQRHAGAARAHADQLSDRALWFGGFGLVGSSLLVTLFCAYQLRFVLLPIRRVGNAARRLAGGDLSTRVAEGGGGEVGDLGRTFNAMADSLEHSRDELESVVDELAEGKERFERLYRIGRAISSAIELEDVAQTVVDELAELAGAELGLVYVSTSGADDQLGCIAGRGIDPTGVASLRPNVGMAGRALTEGRMIAVGRAECGIAVETPGGRIIPRHEVHLPLSAGAEVVGVLTLARVAGGPFRPGDLELLEYLAGRAGSGIANALTLRSARDQAAFNRAVLDTAADAFLSIDSRGAITAYNPAAERMFGWPPREVLGEKVLESFVPERHHGRVEALVNGETQLEELDVLHRDGHELPVEVVVSRLERQGESTYNVFIRDISDRRRADLYMGAQYAVTRVLSESSTLAEARVGVVEALGRALGWQVGCGWILDSEQDVLMPTACWASDDVDAAEFLQITTTSSCRRGEELPGRVWEHGEALWIEDLSREPASPRSQAAVRAGLHGLLSFPIASSSRFFGALEFFSNEVERPDPELLALLATVGTQIGQFSERKRAEAEADRLKDEFFALVSHELRTPLTSIIGYLELVQDDPAEMSADARHFVQVVERNSRRLHRLVGDLLFVAQVEAGRLSLDRAAVPLERVVTDSVEAARPRAEENGVVLGVRTSAVGACDGDGDRLGQMLDNLISNAVKFTPEGGAVDVYLAARGDHAVIEVRDSGLGIPSGEQGRLFQRFFRSSTATEQAIPGVGLGLTISRAIVEAHGGTIDFESEEGSGTTFRVELPLDRQLSTQEPSYTPREVVL